MVWFKVDDQFAFHPKALAAGNAALGLWVRAGSWCGQNLTDGSLPRAMVGPLGGRTRDADALIRAGLWERSVAGYQFLDWSQWQPTKEQVKAEREATKARVQAFREKRRNAVTPTVTNGVSNGGGTPTPTRPDPTRPVLPTEVPLKAKLPSVATPDRFADFWSVYPRRDDPGRAKIAWARAVKKADPQAIIDGARRYASDRNREQQFTKHPTTWLNAESWANEPLPDRSPPERAGSAGNQISTGTQRAMAAVEAARQVSEARNHQLQIGAS